MNDEKLVVCSVLSGNRNFEGRIEQDIKANYLALTTSCRLRHGSLHVNVAEDALEQDSDGNDVYLKDI